MLFPHFTNQLATASRSPAEASSLILYPTPQASMEKTKSQARILDIVYIAMFAALIAVCSWTTIPTIVPFTLQTFGVFLTLGMLGGKRGAAAVVVYVLLGLVGAPVFANFQGGFAVLAGTT